RYGQDKNNDGIEDSTITVRHETLAGRELIAPNQVYVNIGDTYTGLPDVSLAGEGYTYVGYTWDADTSTASTPENPVTRAHIQDAHEVVFLYAQQPPLVATFSVTYFGNANTGGSVPVDVTGPHMAGSQVSVLGNVGSLTRTNYTFAGWSTSQTAASAQYSAGSQFVITADVNLYAVWVPVTVFPVVYTVTYLPGEHGLFSPVSYAGLAFGMATPAPPTVFGEAGWVYVGWSPTWDATVSSAITYTAQWVQQLPGMFTVRFVDWDGTLIKAQQVPRGGSATPPSNPTRSGWAFEGWNGSYANVTADTTVTAQYHELTQDINSFEQVATAPPETLLEMIKDEGVPTMMIAGQETPLAPGTYESMVWALANLVLCVIGGLLVIVGAVAELLRLRKLSRGQEAHFGQNDTQASGQQSRKNRLILLLVAALFALAGIAVFILTQDMSKLMVLFDYWTIVNALVLVAEVVFMALGFRRGNSQEKESHKPASGIGEG
ncbi:MAG: InlB B-repeat-containing protein, partial [Eggerthellaceae bacterium]|nr:InlB B-repeat-containing protein [Eggerthellaceae bacterium]